MATGTIKSVPSMFKTINGNTDSASTAPGSAFNVDIPLPSDATKILFIEAWAQPKTSYNSIAVCSYVLRTGRAVFTVSGTGTQAFTVNYSILYV